MVASLVAVADRPGGSTLRVYFFSLVWVMRTWSLGTMALGRT